MKKVLIVGSGIAGLSAGCYLQMNGYDTEIFELNPQAGGLCAAWKRKEYLIDGCIHWLVGGNPSEGLYEIWNGLLDMKNFPLVTYDEFCSVDYKGKIVRLYADAEKLSRELKGISPEDGGTIDRLTRGIRQFASFNFPAGKAGEVMSITEKMVMIWKMIPALLALLQWRMPAEKYSKRFKDERIRHFLVTTLPGDTPMSIWLMNASWLHKRNSAYPVGGARKLVGCMVRRYESLGGKLHGNAKVEKIIVENNSVKGIRLENGDTFLGDRVISAADGRSTIFEMLEGKYRDKNIDKLYYSGKYEPKTSGLHVSLGVARRFDESYKPYVYFEVKKPLVIDGKEIKTLGVTIHNFDPEAAPEGKTVLTVLITSNDPKYWINLRAEDKKAYEAKKEALSKQVIDELDFHFGNIKNHLEMVDVATPATYARYTNNWNGALMGWTDMSLLFNKPKKQIKGLENFYMCGQWVADAGLPGAVQSGWDVAQILCKKDGKSFAPLTPR